MRYPLVEHGGVGPVVHWAPATGFPLSSYQPILAALTTRYRCLSIPPRAVWPDAGRAPTTAGSWEEVAEEMVQGLVEHRVGPVVAVGHSIGAVASVLAAVRHRSQIRALALLDPTILPPPRMDQFREAKATGWTTMPHPLVGRARERRTDFLDHADAFEYWRPKPLFADWSDAALRCYVEGALTPKPGGGFTLTWSPEWEVYYYESFYAETWDDVRQLDRNLPVLVIGGDQSDTFVLAARKLFAQLVPWAEMVTIPNFGHLFPQAAPEETSRLLLKWLDRVTGETPP